ncbi:sigma-54 interaction domain-containing protein [Zhenpiania hominis]|uniref:HTH-type transcriptional regulatory protein TyrR n=1 Tax=Zhenpiania hominis TaxID=2763644 RepID=A0A923NMP9_9FIRM|nr:sigma 54-interacting transcriptional regulator [Zhenpiania hominis]MBC6680781.1 sigma 54-interacting transcriptional regulator [Zhenpiania hominis]
MERFLETLSVSELIPILNSVKDAVFIDSSDGYSLWCNDACQELYKVTPEEIHGIHISELEKRGIFTPSVAKQVMEQRKEITIIHENRDGKKILSTGTPIFDPDGQMTKIITTSRDITELTSLQKQLEFVQNTLKQFESIEISSSEPIIASSRSMRNVMQLALRLASVDSTVLITGESGVGKGVIAKLLHENGARKEFPFITVNCGAIPESLIESELFGYERGAFTGSRIEGKKGLFEAAQKGTIFLDEISELPLNLQVKLLQVIQDREFTRVGGVNRIPVDVRIISATNKDLHLLVKSGKFREDLYYRLNVVPINVPPLRERPEDILPLIQSNLEKYNNQLGENKTLEPAALAVLLHYSWPGNIRELQNIVERLILTTRDNLITEENLPVFIRTSAEAQPVQSMEHTSLRASMERAEKEVLTRALAEYKSTRAIAKALQVSQPTIVRKLHKYGLTPKEG